MDLFHFALTRFALATRDAAAAQPIDCWLTAGTTILQPLVETTVKDFDHLMAVHVRAALILGQECARSVIARGVGGSILNVLSVASQAGFRDHTAHAPARALSMRVMATELGPYGIRVNAINPGVNLTPMAVKAWSDPQKSKPMLARIPLRRFIDPAEVAEICFFLSDRSSMIHGESVLVDGGFRAN